MAGLSLVVVAVAGGLLLPEEEEEEEAGRRCVGAGKGCGGGALHLARSCGVAYGGGG